MTIDLLDIDDDHKCANDYLQVLDADLNVLGRFVIMNIWSHIICNYVYALENTRCLVFIPNRILCHSVRDYCVHISLTKRVDLTWYMAYNMENYGTNPQRTSSTAIKGEVQTLTNT